MVARSNIMRCVQADNLSGMVCQTACAKDMLEHAAYQESRDTTTTCPERSIITGNRSLGRWYCSLSTCRDLQTTLLRPNPHVPRIVPNTEPSSTSVHFHRVLASAQPHRVYKSASPVEQAYVLLSADGTVGQPGAVIERRRPGSGLPYACAERL